MSPQDVASLLLRLKAVRVSVNPPFTWTSGMKSPVYTDNRIILSHPSDRDLVVDALVGLIHLLPHRPEVIAGTATAGIGWAALVADRLKLPMVYVRPKPKEHGEGKQVEGRLPKGSRVVVVEDLLSTAGSSINTVLALRKEGECEVSDIVAIFTYGFPEAEKKAKEANVALHALSSFAALLGTAEKEGALPPAEIKIAEGFAKDPAKWSVS